MKYKQLFILDSAACIEKLKAALNRELIDVLPLLEPSKRQLAWHERDFIRYDHEADYASVHGYCKKRNALKLTGKRNYVGGYMVVPYEPGETFSQWKLRAENHVGIWVLSGCHDATVFISEKGCQRSFDHESLRSLEPHVWKEIDNIMVGVLNQPNIEAFANGHTVHSHQRQG